MIKTRNNTINPSKEEQKQLEDRGEEFVIKEVWMKAYSRITVKGHYSEDDGDVTILYVPDEKIIDSFKVEPGLSLDSLAKNLLEEVKTVVAPNYVEITIKSNADNTIFINHGKDEGWDQVATFRFSEPKI